VKLRLGLPVSEIRWEKSRVEVCSPRLRKPIRGSRVIITLPLGVLQIPAQVPGSIRFVPDIAEWRQTAMGLASGPVVKGVLRFREAFWECDKSLRDVAFLHDPDGAIPTWWTLRPLRVPVLTAWAGGPKALALAGLSKQLLLAAAIESLAGLLKISQRRLKGLLEDYHCHDWGSDPLSRGAYSYVTVGGMHARRKLIKPIENTLFFTGEALDTTGQASTVAGALASGHSAAKAVGGLSP
jgi:monoamine oxidase